MLNTIYMQFEVLLMADSFSLSHRKSNNTRNNNTPLLPLSKQEGLLHCHRNQMTTELAL